MDLITFQNVLLTIGLAILFYVARTFTELNHKMGIIAEKVTTHDEVLKEHSSDIKELIKEVARR